MPNKRPHAGRPTGKSTNTVKLQNNISADVYKRMEALFPTARKRTTFLEQAIQLQLDVLDGKISIISNV